MTLDAQPRADAVFEISWEVCNKVGGIHTVLKSKAPFLVRAYKDKTYVLVGPWNAVDGGEFERRDAPMGIVPVLDELARRGIPCAYGSWKTAGDPAVILVDFRSLFPAVNDLKHRLWERFGIDSLNARYDFDEPLCFATAAGMLVEEYAKQRQGKVVAHCHEWMTGFALLHLRACGSPAAGVFTTHATMLGRSISGAGHDLYAMLAEPSFDARAWAYRMGVQEKHLTELACAKEADAFTTVSDITGKESERILGRAPTVLTYNGFHTDRFPTFEETTVRHNASRDLLRDLIASLHIPVAPFDLDTAPIIITGGRYEVHNKGIDVIVRALALLNERLRAEKSERTVIMLFLVMRDRGPLRQDVSDRWSSYQRIRSAIEWDGRRILRRIALDLLAGQPPGSQGLFTADVMADLRESATGVRHANNAPLVTHELADEGNDPLLRLFQAAGLRNRADDRVKVLFLPGMADGSDGLLNIAYYDALVGAHLGVFPSAYEPWGYTPLESALLGVTTITTDATGFGQYVRANVPQHDTGVIVLSRLGTSDEEFSRRLAESFAWFLALDHTERITHGFAAQRIARGCDWSSFVNRYLRAHDDALAARGR